MLRNPGAEDQVKYAYYSSFRLTNEVTYDLEIGGFSTSENYATGDSLSNHNGVKFSTFDKDNDEGAENCAQNLNTAGW